MSFQLQFIEACKIGDFNTVKSLLVNENVNPIYDNNSAIRWATYNGHYKVVKLLLEDKRINPADYSNYAIQLASRNGHYKIVKLFLFTTMR